MDTNPTESSSAPLTETPEEISRRRFFEKLSIALVGLCTAIVGGTVSRIHRRPRFFSKGAPGNGSPSASRMIFKIGKTVAVTVTESFVATLGRSHSEERRLAKDEWTLTTSSRSQLTAHILAVRCAGWRAPDLFMCPCHGGVYYSDGNVAARAARRLPLFPLRRAGCKWRGANEAGDRSDFHHAVIKIFKIVWNWLDDRLGISVFALAE